MDTSEIVRRLTDRPVTPSRALKVLHLLETPEQLAEVLAALSDEHRAIVEAELTPPLVTRHFAMRRR